MRLSATDRIIREAEQHDDAAVEAADHPDTEKVSAAPFVALGIPAPRMPTPLGGGVDIDPDGDDGHEDEGETQVDAQRSAAALQEMRALQAHHTPPPALTGRPEPIRQRGLPAGRPGGTALTGASAPAAAATSPSRTLIFGSPGPAPAERPPAVLAPTFARPAADIDIDVDDDRPDPLFSPSPLQVGATTLPAGDVGASGLSAPIHRTGRVSRRTGMAVAASTALAVALIAGAWTTKKSPPEASATPLPPPVLPSSLLPGANAPTPPRPSAPVVVATRPAPARAETGALPAEAPPSPAMADEVAPPVTTETTPVPVTASDPGEAPSRRAQAAGAKKAALKARITKKRAVATTATAAKRKARAHKPGKAVAAPVPGIRQAPASASATTRPSAARSADAARGRGDPDDTLPITD